MENADFDDEFDDIPDEDMIQALAAATQPAASSLSTCASATRSSGPVFELDDIPSDAFDDSIFPGTTTPLLGASGSAPRSQQPPRLARESSLRQTTLWGGLSSQQAQPAPQQSRPGASRPLRADAPPEPPTHHELNRDALKTWVYPLNLGTIRDYQFSIVKSGLYNNTLVALPTGLGKTFIAATVMLNFFRWTKTAKIVFVAPTKPLVSQQVDACLNVAGIPRSQATLLTGDVGPHLRVDEWASKRLFFMTPQTLMNDLSKGYADPKSIVLLVIDEAHRATGDYAYVKVVHFIRRFSSSFRVLALTATPGSSVEGVQGIIDNLGVSHVEIRTEESLDIRQYVHSRDIQRETFEPSDEMREVQALFSQVLRPLLDKLSAQHIFWGRDPMHLSTFGLLKVHREWMNGPGKHANQGVKWMISGVAAVLKSLAHSIKLLNFHGIKPFYHYLAGYRDEAEEARGGSKYKNQVLQDGNFLKMMRLIQGWMKIDGFTGHPKMDHLVEILANHFLDAGEGSNTRAIVFNEYRDSAEEIVKFLNAQPLLKANVFVGQADSKRSEGMTQKQQIGTLEKFKTGAFNVLVATSIGEEGLDIGQVDLIVCFDASASPIRMLQRMGRTGRKRAGKIVLLLMKGKEEDKFNQAKDNYEFMQKLICEGSRFDFRYDLSARIVPRDVMPEVDKRMVEIPIENSQDNTLPEPKKTNRRKQAIKKKFNMPDNVETGFRKASTINELFRRTKAKPSPNPTRPSAPVVTDTIVECPPFESVVLNEHQTGELHRIYRNLPSLREKVDVIPSPSLTAYPAYQRNLRPTVRVKHGGHTKRCVELFRKLGESQEAGSRYTTPYGTEDRSNWRRLSEPPLVDDGTNIPAKASTKRMRQPSIHGAEEGSSGDKISRPTKRRDVSKITSKSATSRARPAAISLECAESDGPERSQDTDGPDTDDDDDGEPTETPARGQHRQARLAQSRRGTRRPGIGTRHRKDDHLEELGDDCMRTSDMDMTDGSDNGSDLAGFVVADDAVTSSLQRSGPDQTSPPTTPTPASSPACHRSYTEPNNGDDGSDDDASTPAPRAVKGKPFFVPLDLSSTQRTEDEDLPDFGRIATSTNNDMGVDKGGSSGNAQRGSRVVRSEDDEPVEDVTGKMVPKKRQAVRRRHQIFVQDSDES